jgi:hypothetical protein
MYRLRPFRPSDWQALFDMHEGAFEIPTRMEEAVVAEDETTGKVVAIQGCRATREAYIWIDHDWKTPKLRWRVFEEMHEALRAELERRGIADVHIFVEATKSGGHSGFAKRLMKRLGYEPAVWKAYSRKVKK